MGCGGASKQRITVPHIESPLKSPFLGSSPLQIPILPLKDILAPPEPLPSNLIQASANSCSYSSVISVENEGEFGSFWSPHKSQGKGGREGLGVGGKQGVESRQSQMHTTHGDV